MAEAKTIIGRVKNRKDTHSNWVSNNPILLDGELAAITKSNIDGLNNMTMFVLGDGKKKITELMFGEQKDSYLPTDRSENNAVFYSGIGAGYKLPVATSTTLGGIKLNSNYFHLESQQLVPSLYRIVTQGDLPPRIQIQEGYQLWADEFVGIEKTHTLTDFIIYLNSVVGDDQNPLFENMSELKPYAGMMVEAYKKENNVNINAFLGIDLNGRPCLSKNFIKNDTQGLNSLSMKYIPYINSDAEEGLLQYTKTDKLWQTVNLKPLKINVLNDGDLSQTVEYNPLTYRFTEEPIEINTMTKYCTNITVNGITYDLNDNHNINLGQSIWTDAERDKLNTAVSDISDINKNLEDVETRIPVAVEFLGTNYILEEDQKFVINPSLESVVPLSSSTNTIVITMSEEGGKERYKLEHYDVNPDVDKFFYEITVGSNIESGEVDNIIGVGQIVCDNYGHLTKVSLNQYKMGNLITRISNLETSNSNLTKQISELTNKNNALTNDIDGLKEQLKQATNLINNLTERVTNLENSNTESE